MKPKIQDTNDRNNSLNTKTAEHITHYKDQPCATYLYLACGHGTNDIKEKSLMHNFTGKT